MITTGKLIGVTKNLISGKFNVTFEIDTCPDFGALSKIEKLEIKADKFRKKRSLDANAYWHQLIGKMAPLLNISFARCKNLLIARYGQPELLPDGSIMYYKTNAPEDYMFELETLHSFPVKHEAGATFYRIMRGSHTYDTKEMSVLINGTVDEAKTLGIETETPENIERMLNLWQGKLNQSSQESLGVASYAETLM